MFTLKNGVLTTLDTDCRSKKHIRFIYVAAINITYNLTVIYCTLCMLYIYWVEKNQWYIFHPNIANILKQVEM